LQQIEFRVSGGNAAKSHRLEAVQTEELYQGAFGEEPDVTHRFSAIPKPG
jgi:hypothetical protein